jgi:hypothetical protein
MAPTAADQQQRLSWLAVALFVSSLTIVARRTIQGGREVGARAQPIADLQSVSPYLIALSDTSGLAKSGGRPMVVTRDPFAPTGIARSGNSSSRTPVDGHLPIAAGGENWVVSTILFEGSKKSAIVNNAWVTIGDTLSGGSRLTAVERDHIVVTDAKGVRHKVPIQGGESW